MRRKRQSCEERGGKLSKRKGPEAGTHQPGLSPEGGLLWVGTGEKGEVRSGEGGAGVR